MGRVRTLIVTACTLAVFGALAGCNSFEPKVDGKKVARAIEQSARNQFGEVDAVVGKASCPDGRKQKKGDHFDCHVKIDEQDVVYVARQTTDHGDVAFDLETPFLLFSTINDQVLANLRGQGLDDVTVACGYAHVWFVKPPLERDCVLTFPDKSQRNAHVTLAADGGVDSVKVEGLDP